MEKVIIDTLPFCFVNARESEHFSRRKKELFYETLNELEENYPQSDIKHEVDPDGGETIFFIVKRKIFSEGKDD